MFDLFRDTVTQAAASVTSRFSSGSVNLTDQMQSIQPSQSATPTPSSQPSQQRTPQSNLDASERVAVILLLGSSGSGKTLLLERTLAKNGAISNDVPIKSTTSITIRHHTIDQQKFVFIDTPGFDHPDLTNLEPFTKLAKQLLDEVNIQFGITGVVYIHRAGDYPESKTLIQNMRVLVDVFLGKSVLRRLTILVVPGRSTEPLGTLDAQELLRIKAFHTTRTHKAKVMVATLEKKEFIGVLRGYISKHPVHLRIQRKHLENPQTHFKQQIEEYLGYYEEDSPINTYYEAKLRERNLKIKSLQTSLAERDSRISQVSSVYTQVEQQFARSREEFKELELEHQKTQSEYASLRSQLQLQENIEQSEVVQALKDLNRDIDSIGRSISEYLVDKYVQEIFGKDAAEITALDARHLPELMKAFDHVAGGPSLISSSSGVGMSIEDFLDYSIRCFVCQFLHTKIFEPFHPGADPSASNILATMYEDIRRREVQAVTGKWRADSFKSIYRPESDDAVTHLISTFALELAHGDLEPLIECIFGRGLNIQLGNQHLERLVQLVRATWEWNSMLKGKVIMLGDFSIIWFSPTSPYDPVLMSEFEPRPQSSRPESILGTLALGLMSSRSLGGGQDPEVTVVYKAMVATSNLYD